MKTFALLSLVLFFAKYTSAQTQNPAFFINGKQFHSKDSISRTDLFEICSFEISNANGYGHTKPVSFEVLINGKKGLFKKECMAGAVGLGGDFTTGDIIFIDHFKFKTATGFSREQLVLTVK